MSLTTILSLLALTASAIANPLEFEKRACNADNCARAITGTANQPVPISKRMADCNSFLATTVTPAASVSTTVVILSANQATPAAQAPLVTTAQTVRPTGVPTYATMCGTASTQLSRYSSACACFTGVTATITTAPTPTVTTTSYSTPLSTCIVTSDTVGPLRYLLYTNYRLPEQQYSGKQFYGTPGDDSCARYCDQNTNGGTGCVAAFSNPTLRGCFYFNRFSESDISFQQGTDLVVPNGC